MVPSVARASHGPCRRHVERLRAWGAFRSIVFQVSRVEVLGFRAECCVFRLAAALCVLCIRAASPKTEHSRRHEAPRLELNAIGRVIFPHFSIFRISSSSCLKPEDCILRCCSPNQKLKGLPGHAAQSHAVFDSSKKSLTFGFVGGRFTGPYIALTLRLS